MYQLSVYTDDDAYSDPEPAARLGQGLAEQGGRAERGGRADSGVASGIFSIGVLEQEVFRRLKVRLQVPQIFSEAATRRSASRQATTLKAMVDVSYKWYVLVKFIFLMNSFFSSSMARSIRYSKV